jgi:GT2 family glycosyltransferase
VSDAALPQISLVICTRNRPRLLRETITSLLAADDVPDEIVVVDQSDSEDHSLEALPHDRATALRVVGSRPNGLGSARNLGIAEARHDLLVFVDDDMWAHPAWLRRLVGALVEAPPRTVVTGAVESTESESWRAFTPSTQAHEPGAVFVGRLDRDVLAGGHMAIERSALDEVGGFDPRFGAGARYPAADDNDLGYRLLERGYRIVYVADAVLYHRAWRPGWRYPIVRWRYGRGKGGFYAKHARADGLHMLRRARRDIGQRIRRLPSLLVRHPVRAAGDILYVLGVFVGGSRWLLEERRA